MSRIVYATSTLTRPANTTAYAQNDLIADNTTAGSIVVPSLTLTPRVPYRIVDAKFRTDLATGFGTFAGLIELWSAAPTFTNGDNGAYAVATGAANWLGQLQTDVATQVADGAYAAVNFNDTFGVAAAGPFIIPPLNGGSLYWSLKETDATGFTPASGTTFTLVLGLETIAV